MDCLRRDYGIRVLMNLHFQAYVQNKILMDPSALEEESEDGSLVVSYMPSLNEITHILQNGNTESAIANKVNDGPVFLIHHSIVSLLTNWNLSK
jgi:hypothetical protein